MAWFQNALGMSTSHQISSLICLASVLLSFAIDAVVNSSVFHSTAFQIRSYLIGFMTMCATDCYQAYGERVDAIIVMVIRGVRGNITNSEQN